MSPNVAAFLSMISHAEGTDRPGMDPYRCCYAYRHITVDLSIHPAMGEWVGADGHPGELITMGKYAGQHTTAAGRYQINLPTWKRLAMRLRSRSFLPYVQDDMAVELLKENGAFMPINVGDLETAIQMCSRTWASLPFSDAGQHPKSLELLVDTYRAAGGTLLA